MAALVLLTPLLMLISVTLSTSRTTRDEGCCPDYWVKFGHSCYKLIIDKYRWHDAQNVCKKVDSTLVNIGSLRENKFVRRMAHKKGVSVWIGLSDVVQEGSFVWIDTQEDPKYTNWFKGEPDNYKGKEDCVELAYYHGGKWNDADCENKFSVICEKHTDDDGEDQEQESRASGRCPDSWMVFGKSCYKIILESQNWNEAQAMCKTLQSSLVNIGSREEDEFLVGLAKKNGITAWIGLTDLVQEKNFVWNDTQKQPTYTHWLPGEPNNGNRGREHCAALWYEFGNLWNDEVCENKNGAICEKQSSVNTDQYTFME